MACIQESLPTGYSPSYRWKCRVINSGVITTNAIDSIYYFSHFSPSLCSRPLTWKANCCTGVLTLAGTTAQGSGPTILCNLCSMCLHHVKLSADTQIMVNSVEWTPASDLVWKQCLIFDNSGAIVRCKVVLVSCLVQPDVLRQCQTCESLFA